MISGELSQDFGPNVSHKASDFFQSDQDIAKQEAKETKRNRHATTGQPIHIPSKVLDLQFGSDAHQAGSMNDKFYAYVAVSGHVARRYNLTVGDG